MKNKYFDNYVSTIYKQIYILDNSEYASSVFDFDKYLSSFLPKDKNSSISDIGCGSGFFLYFDLC